MGKYMALTYKLLLIKNLLSTIKRIGFQYLWLNLLNIFAAKLGLFKFITKKRKWEEISLKEILIDKDNSSSPLNLDILGNFFYSPEAFPIEELKRIIDDDKKKEIINIADRCCRGEFLYFSNFYGSLGTNPNWSYNPFNNAYVRNDDHWSRYKLFDKYTGDIKFIWEPSRFMWAFWLARSYVLTGDEKYPKSFFKYFESWLKQNPPNTGPNWISGQEIALRVLSIIFAFFVFRDFVDERIFSMLIKFIYESTKRIDKLIFLSSRQKNNHIISEACALFSVGLLFKSFKDAAKWEKKGKKIIEREIARQIYCDGSYVQQSMNYHRMVLQLVGWVIRLGAINDIYFNQYVLERINKALVYLVSFINDENGRVPNYGSNDGSLILQLDACDYLDFRPTAQMISYILSKKVLYKQGPWDEPIIWLYGKKSTIERRKKAYIKEIKKFPLGGYYKIKSKNSWCLIKCNNIGDRSPHCDPLHVDLWWREINILRDAGTFRYFYPEDPLLEKYFYSIEAHNSVEIDNKSPTVMLKKFLQVPWIKGKTIRFNNNVFIGEHYGYNRYPWNVIHRRIVSCDNNDEWSIKDYFLGKGNHLIRLFLHFPIYECESDKNEIKFNLPYGICTTRIMGPESLNIRIIRGKEKEYYGFESLYYSVLNEQILVVVEFYDLLPASIEVSINLENKK